MKLIYYSQLSLFFSLILENPGTFVLTLHDFRTFIRLMCSQPLSLFHYLESAPSQVLLLWSDTCHFSKLSSSTSVAFTSVLEILCWPLWSTSWMSVQPSANSACHLLSLCHHYTSASVVEFKWGKHFFSHWTPFLTGPSLHCSSCTSACLMNGIWPTHHLLHFNHITSVASRLEMKCMTNTEAAGQDTLLTEHTSLCWQTVKLGNYSMLVFLPSIL
jgi:hypothetical protein